MYSWGKQAPKDWRPAIFLVIIEMLNECRWHRLFGGYLLKDLPFPEQSRRMSRSLYNDSEAWQEGTQHCLPLSWQWEQSGCWQALRHIKRRSFLNSVGHQLDLILKPKAGSFQKNCLFVLCHWDLCLPGHPQTKRSWWNSWGGCILRMS